MSWVIYNVSKDPSKHNSLGGKTQNICTILSSYWLDSVVGFCVSVVVYFLSILCSTTQEFRYRAKTVEFLEVLHDKLSLQISLVERLVSLSWLVGFRLVVKEAFGCVYANEVNSDSAIFANRCLTWPYKSKTEQM